MDKIYLETLILERLHMDREAHQYLLEKLNNDENVRKFLMKIEDSLPCNLSKSIYHSQFVVYDQTQIVGYVSTSSLFKLFRNQPEIVLISEAVVEEQRRKSYGTKILTEIADYCFYKETPSAPTVGFCASPVNEGSMKLVSHTGYTLYKDDIYMLKNPSYKKQR